MQYSKSSVVLTCSNDGYKDTKRITTSIFYMLESFDEVILVDWASPIRLDAAIYPYLPRTGRLKYIYIDSNIAKQVAPTNIKFYETMARNIGIRRASHDWIISSNVDIIPDMREICQQTLQSLRTDTLYTVRRIEVPIQDFYIQYNLYATRDKCSRYNSIGYLTPISTLTTDSIDGYEHVKIDCCGDMQIAHKDIWYTIRGFEECMYHRNYADWQLQIKAAKYGYNISLIEKMKIWHIQHLGGIGTNTNYNPIDDINIYPTKNTEDWGIGNSNLTIKTI